MEFKIEINGHMEADDLDDAFLQLTNHFKALHEGADHSNLSDALELTVEQASPIYIGTSDKHGTPIKVGDYLDFDEKEWGGLLTPEIVPPLIDFVEEWPLSGSFNDISEFRTIVNKPK